MRASAHAPPGELPGPKLQRKLCWQAQSERKVTPETLNHSTTRLQARGGSQAARGAPLLRAVAGKLGQHERALEAHQRRRALLLLQQPARPRTLCGQCIASIECGPGARLAVLMSNLTLQEVHPPC